MKVCFECNKNLPLDNFAYQNKKLGKYKARCRPCEHDRLAGSFDPASAYDKDMLRARAKKMKMKGDPRWQLYDHDWFFKLYGHIELQDIGKIVGGSKSEMTRVAKFHDVRRSGKNQYDGKIAIAAEGSGIKLSTVYARIAKGDTIEDALRPVERNVYEAYGEKKTLTAWSKDIRCEVSDKTLSRRVATGMDLLVAMKAIAPVQYEAFGESRSLADWAIDPRAQVSYSTISSRLNSGWDIVEALATPSEWRPPKRLTAFGETKTYSEWVSDDRCVCDNPHTLRTRVKTYGFSPEDAITSEMLDNTSEGERSLADFVQTYTDIERNVRSAVPKYEIDIFIPNLMMAIEYNGIYWHSEAIRKKAYHYDKWKACNDAEIKLIQIWEDDWLLREGVVKKMLLHKLGFAKEGKMGARQCTVSHVGRRECVDFLEANHIQGSATSSVRLGLRSPGGELVALCVFLRASTPDKPWSLVRYATSRSVTGGFSRLLKAFVREYHPVQIVTFADLCISNGDLYQLNGFIEDSLLPPDYRYVYDGKRVHKFNFRKGRFKRDKRLKYDPSMTERELAELNGIPRIYDAGKIRYTLTPDYPDPTRRSPSSSREF